MRTTSSKSPDWKINQNKWEQEILEFCDGYRFVKLDGSTLGVEVEYYSQAGPDIAFVQFRALLQDSERRLIELDERSKLVRKRGHWSYLNGKLIEYDGSIL